MNTLLPILAVVSGQAFISVIMWLIVIGLIFWLLWWLVAYIAPPEPFAKILRVIIAVAAVFVCINALLSLVGHSLIEF